MKKSQNLNNKVWISGAIKTSEIKKNSRCLNLLLWLIIASIIILGTVINTYLNNCIDYEYSITTFVVIFIMSFSIIIARFTNEGRNSWNFFKASKLELAKVVWPTRKETLSISVMIIVIVMVFALIISLFGIIFENFIQFFLS